MIMVRPVRLNVSVVLVQAQIDLARQCLIIPSGLPVAVPILRRSGIKRHAVENYPEQHIVTIAVGSAAGAGVQRNPEKILLG